MPPSVAAFAASRALQTLGCCEMLSPRPCLAMVPFRCLGEGERGEAAFHYSPWSHLVVQSTVKGGDPSFLTLDYISGFRQASLSAD